MGEGGENREALVWREETHAGSAPDQQIHQAILIIMNPRNVTSKVLSTNPITLAQSPETKVPSLFCSSKGLLLQATGNTSVITIAVSKQQM